MLAHPGDPVLETQSIDPRLLRRGGLRARHVVPATATALLSTVEALVSFGEKRVGTLAGARAAAYLLDRFRGAGLDGVALDEFAFPRHDVLGAAFSVSGRAVPFDVLEGCGPGEVRGELIDCGTASEVELAGLDLRGRLALVRRNPFYHRSTQYLEVAARGAAAMIFLSAAPENLRQVGSIRRGFESMGAIPAITVGADDGDRLLDLASRRVRAELRIDARTTRSSGANVVAHIPGREPGRIVVGAHYDTWFAGAADNCAGVAAMLALAELRASREEPRYGLTFVAWDGEEVALYGGYHFLRRYGDDLLAVIDLETPSARGGVLHALAHSESACLDLALRAGGLDRLYPAYFPMALVPRLFGGVIPTDVQGMHRAGIPSVATAVDTPYYHTVRDTADLVDPEHLSMVVAGFDHALDRLLATPREELVIHDDDERLELDVLVDGRAVRVDVRDAGGAPVPELRVDATFLADDFFLGWEERGVTRVDGRCSFAIPEGPGYLHVTAGGVYPLAERIVAISARVR